MRYVLLAVAPVAVIAGEACACGSEESPAEKASEELNRGLQAHAAGDLDEAPAAYREVLTHDPQNKHAFYNLGLIDQTSGCPGPAENNNVGSTGASTSEPTASPNPNPRPTSTL
jgi:Tfp pilus assembly protein PilF